MSKLECLFSDKSKLPKAGYLAKDCSNVLDDQPNEKTGGDGWNRRDGGYGRDWPISRAFSETNGGTMSVSDISILEPAQMLA